MQFLRKEFAGSPDCARIAPFAIFVGLTDLQGQFGEASRYWFYLVKTLLGAWLIWEMRPFVEEMRWKVSREAVVAGVVVFAIWVALDGLYPRFSELDAGWNPNQAFGQGSALVWLYTTVRIAGSSIIVPPLETLSSARGTKHGPAGYFGSAPFASLCQTPQTSPTVAI
jgi:hypothetical protein